MSIWYRVGAVTRAGKVLWNICPYEHYMGLQTNGKKMKPPPDQQ